MSNRLRIMPSCVNAVFEASKGIDVETMEVRRRKTCCLTDAGSTARSVLLNSMSLPNVYFSFSANMGMLRPEACHSEWRLSKNCCPTTVLSHAVSTTMNPLLLWATWSTWWSSCDEGICCGTGWTCLIMSTCFVGAGMLKKEVRCCCCLLSGASEARCDATYAKNEDLTCCLLESGFSLPMLRAAANTDCGWTVAACERSSVRADSS
jgi:hypothetical protein